MNIAFVANYHKTEFFSSIAEKLSSRANEIFWLSPSRKWADWVINDGFKSSRVLDITKYGEMWTESTINQKDYKELSYLEQCGPLSTRDIILRDRVLKYKNYKKMKKYISIIARKVREFVKRKGIEVVFGEQTWAFEMVVCQVCNDIQVKYLMPKSIRIPNNRFAFFPAPNQSKIVKINDIKNNHRKKAKNELRRFKNNKPKPDYYSRKKSLPTPSADWLLKPFNASKDPYNETRFHWRDIGRYKPRDINRVLRSFRTLLGSPFEVSTPPNFPYVFITLHRQPEASVDVLGGYFSNQLETIKAISRSAPSSHKILVKEHSSAIGDRGPNFYSKLSGIPGVSTVDPYVDSFPFLEKSDLVVSISGTASYEAALLGQPAATVAPMFFGPLLVCNGWNPYNSSLEDMSEMLGSKDQLPCREDKINFLSYILAQSFNGIISDPTQSKECMSTGNINKVSDGFRLLLDDL
jgi:hypothetical protein